MRQPAIQSAGNTSATGGVTTAASLRSMTLNRVRAPQSIGWPLDVLRVLTRDPTQCARTGCARPCTLSTRWPRRRIARTHCVAIASSLNVGSSGRLTWSRRVNSFALSPSHPGWLLSDESDRQLLDFLRATCWSRSALSIDSPEHIEIAAHAVAIGAVVCHPFANFYVFSGRPSEAVVNYVNRVKGRPPDQTGSVVTTPERIVDLFDWDRLPHGLNPEQIVSLMRLLLELGPFGFRGPARRATSHLDC
jgi:hypothetical protein